jgi:heptosyltransferase-1
VDGDHCPPIIDERLLMNLLFVKLGSIGDVVHTLPALAATRRAFPRARIAWAVERRAAEILRDNFFLDDLIELDTKGLRRMAAFGETLSAASRQLRRLRVSPFDRAIDFQGLIKSALVGKLSGAPRRFGFARASLREPLARVFYTDAVSIPPRAHVIRKNLILASKALDVDLSLDAEDFEFPIATSDAHTREAEAIIKRFVSDAAAGFAILNPGGNWRTKLWSAEKFGALADVLWQRHRLRSLVTFGPDERKLAERVAQASKILVHPDERAAVAIRSSLKGFYELAKRARIYVGGDTGPTHLAVAARAPLVGLYGPTEWWRNGSPRAADVCVERTDIGCRENCHRRACGNWICMDIDVAQVAEAVAERLRRAEDDKVSDKTSGMTRIAKAEELTNA